MGYPGLVLLAGRRALPRRSSAGSCDLVLGRLASRPAGARRPGAGAAPGRHGRARRPQVRGGTVVGRGQPGRRGRPHRRAACCSMRRGVGAGRGVSGSVIGAGRGRRGHGPRRRGGRRRGPRRRGKRAAGRAPGLAGYQTRADLRSGSPRTADAACRLPAVESWTAAVPAVDRRLGRRTRRRPWTGARDASRRPWLAIRPARWSGAPRSCWTSRGRWACTPAAAGIRPTGSPRTKLKPDRSAATGSTRCQWPPARSASPRPARRRARPRRRAGPRTLAGRDDAGPGLAGRLRGRACGTMSGAGPAGASSGAGPAAGSR